jgi:hypothetical protein
MSFIYEERLSEIDTEKANALARNVGVNDDVYSQWVIDRERDVVMLCFELTSRMMKGPGKYGLFIKDRGIIFRVQYKGINEEGVDGAVIVFDNLSLEIPDNFGVPREVIIHLIQEALDVLGMSMPYTALVRVNIK